MPLSQEETEEDNTTAGFWHKTKKDDIWISTVQPIQLAAEGCEDDANGGDLDDNIQEGGELVT